MNKIIHDVTTLMGWKGRFVGIARAESELARYLASEYNGEIDFYIFSKFSKKFYSVPKEDVLKQIKFIEGNGSNFKKEANTSSQNHINNKKSIKSLVMKVIRIFPSRISDFLYVISKSLRHFYLYLNHRVFLVKNKISSIGKHFNNAMKGSNNTMKYSEAFLEKNNIYVSLGLDWDDKDFGYMYSLKEKVGFKMVLFCYDLIPVKFPHLCVMSTVNNFSRYFTNLLWCANLVLCISKNTEKDLLDFAIKNSAPRRKTEIITLGSNISTEKDNSQDKKNTKTEDYILYVSTFEARKNHEVLYKALLRLSDLGYENLPKFKFVGMPGWGVNDLYLRILNDPVSSNNIKILHGVSEDELIELYKNCKFTVFPSIYEGWGLGVAESLAFGKFCICANTSSLPEVGGDLVEYIEPYDVVKWSERLLYYYNNPEKVIEKEKLIKERYIKPTWNNYAKDFITKIEKFV